MSESVVTRLNNEWAELADHTWVEPLSGVDSEPDYTFANLAQLARGFDHVAFGLLLAAQAGSASAGRVLLQAMLPRLVRLSQSHEAAIDDLLAAAWVRIMRHPMNRKKAIVVNLSLDSLKNVTRTNQRLRREFPLPYPPDDPDPGSAVVPLRAAEVLEVAARHRLAPDESLKVMHSVYVDGLSGRAAADRHGTSPEMIRYRCSAGMKALRNNSALLREAA